MRFPNARPIFERLAYVCYFVVLIGSIGITWLGWIIGMETGNFTAMFVALGGLVVARGLNVYGFAHWHFRDCQNSLDAFGSSDGIPRSEHEERLSTEIATLFIRLESEDDVWARGQLRNEIAAKLAVAPTLRDDFPEVLARHPEL